MYRGNIEVRDKLERAMIEDINLELNGLHKKNPDKYLN